MNGRASGPVLQSVFLAVFVHSGTDGWMEDSGWIGRRNDFDYGIPDRYIWDGSRFVVQSEKNKIEKSPRIFLVDFVSISFF